MKKLRPCKSSQAPILVVPSEIFDTYFLKMYSLIAYSAKVSLVLSSTTKAVKASKIKEKISQLSHDQLTLTTGKFEELKLTIFELNI